MRPDWPLLAAVLLGGAAFAVLLMDAPLLGHDWLSLFARQPHDILALPANVPYPPWVIPILLRPLTVFPVPVSVALIKGLTLACVTLISYREGRRAFPHNRLVAVVAVLLAAVNPLTWGMLWLGQIDMLVLIGVIIMPYGVPFVLAKPQIGMWVILNSRRDMLIAAAVLALSLVIWGFWPSVALNPAIFNPHPALFGWHYTSVVVGLVGAALLVFTNRDPFRLMAAGSLVSPYLLPYHFIVLLPALGRAAGVRQAVLWLASLGVFAVAGVPTPAVKTLALAFPLLVWALLAPSLRPRDLFNDPDTLFRRGLGLLGAARHRVAHLQRQPR
jgi:hypothetical protein